MTITGPIPDRILRLMPAEERASLGKSGETMQEAYARASLRSERELQDQIANWFLLNGIYAERQRMDKKSNLHEGAPDFRCCYHGAFVAFEVKVGSNHTTPEQERELGRIRQSGGQAFVVRSLVEVKTILEKMK